MGGKPKGLLPAPGGGEALVVHSCRLARAVGLSPCLVGRAEAYRALLPDLEAVRSVHPLIERIRSTNEVPPATGDADAQRARQLVRADARDIRRTRARGSERRVA